MNAAVREALELFARPAEHEEMQSLVRRAELLDGERQRITARMNVLRQRFSQRRLAAERGQPFRKAKPRAAIEAAAKGDEG